MTPRRIIVGAGLLLATAILISLLLIYPRIEGVYEAYYSRESVERLFVQELGMSESSSHLAAIVVSFFYALAWAPLFWWTYRFILGRYNAKQLIAAFTCSLFIYGFAPALREFFGSDVCFNPVTGEPIKWYTKGDGEKITLYDRPGFDPWTGAERRLVTPEICRAHRIQEARNRSPEAGTTATALHCIAPKHNVLVSPAVNVTWEHKHDIGGLTGALSKLFSDPGDLFSGPDHYGLQITLTDIALQNCWPEDPDRNKGLTSTSSNQARAENVAALSEEEEKNSDVSFLTAEICNNGEKGILDRRPFYMWYVPDTHNTTVTWLFEIDYLPTGGACRSFTGKFLREYDTQDISLLSKVAGTFHFSPRRDESFMTVDAK
jgi:hypothetical protein